MGLSRVEGYSVVEQVFLFPRSKETTSTETECLAITHESLQQILWTLAAP